MTWIGGDRNKGIDDLLHNEGPEIIRTCLDR